jgi:CRP-like cAMP-binding protein
MSTLSEFIQSIHAIPDGDLELLTRGLRTKGFRKGEHIVSPGQIERKFFIVKSGVQMYHFETAGKTNILGFAYPPSFCAIPESFLKQKPAQYYLTCLTDSEFDYLSFDQLQKLFDESASIERLFRKLYESVIVGLINRQIELRSTTIEERFKAFFKRSPHLFQLIPHKYIASYLAIDPTNFSKLFNSVKM